MFVCGIDAGNWLFGKNYQDKFIMQNNAIVAEKFRYCTEKSEIEKKRLNVENKLVIGHVGRFFRQKNHEFLIDIFAEIKRMQPQSVLLLVGSGDLEEAVHEKVSQFGLEESVIFLGNRDDVAGIMQAFDLFLFPSLCEGLPVTMVEAQAAGLKCFISDRVPTECILTETVEIISLDKSASEWAEEILEEMKTYERKDTYQEIVDAHFDIVENAKWLERFYLDESRKS